MTPIFEKLDDGFRVTWWRSRSRLFWASTLFTCAAGVVAISGLLTGALIYVVSLRPGYQRLMHLRPLLIVLCLIACYLPVLIFLDWRQYFRKRDTPVLIEASGKVLRISSQLKSWGNPGHFETVNISEITDIQLSELNRAFGHGAAGKLLILKRKSSPLALIIPNYQTAQDVADCLQTLLDSSKAEQLQPCPAQAVTPERLPGNSESHS